MYFEELLSNQERGRIETRDAILAQCVQRQQQDLITDVFLLVAVVMRDRCGTIRKHADVLWDTLWRQKNIQIFSFSCFGLLCNIIIASLLWYNGAGTTIDGGIYVYKDLHTSEVKESTSRYAALVLLQIALSTSTLVCCVLIYQRAVMYTQEKRHLWSGIDMLQFTKAMLSHQSSSEYKGQVADSLHSSYTLWNSTHRARMCIEIALHSIHPIIWLNETGPSQVFFRVLQMAIFVRLYFAINLVFLLSEAYQSRREILAKNVELQGTGSGITLGLTLKIFYFTWPATFTAILMLGTLTVLGFVMFLAERNSQPQNNKFGSLTNSYWFAFQTFTTVGYGDIVPVSPFGRFVAVLIGSSGILITTVLSGVIINLVAASREQRFIQDYLDKAHAGAALRNSAASAIQAAYRFFKVHGGDAVMPGVKRKGHKSNFLYKTLETFSDNRWRFTKSISTAGDPVVDSKLNFVRTDLFQCVTRLEDHEKSLTATLDNLHQRVADIIRILDDE